MLNANKISPLLKTLVENGENNLFAQKGITTVGEFGIKKYVTLPPIKYNVLANDLYGASKTCIIPSSLGYLAQITLKLTLASAIDNLSIQPYLASKLFKFIYFETVAGAKTIQRITPHYTMARLDNLKDVSMFYNCMNPDVPIDGNVVTTYNPLFLWFSEDTSNFINLNHVEPLQLTMVTEDDYQKMSLNTGLNYIIVEPILTVFSTSGGHEKVHYRFLSYDCIDEPILSLTTGATSSIIEIKTKRTVYCMHMLIKHDSDNSLKINSFQLSHNNEVIIDHNRFSSIEMWNEVPSYTSNTLTYWFSAKRCRTENTFALNLHDLKTNLTVNYDSVPSTGYKLYVFFEYFTLNEIQGRKYKRLEYY